MNNKSSEIKVEKGVAGFASDYNCIYHAPAGLCMHWSGKNCTWEEWKHHSKQDNHSIHQDPLFTKKEYDDFKLRANSPCINAGIEVGLQGVDYYGNPIPYGAFDIGIQERQPSPTSILNRFKLRLKSLW